MATQDIGGLLFGGGGTGLEEYLTPQQQQNISNQAVLSAAASLFAAQKRRPVGTGPTFGEAIGGALMSGVQGYQQAQQGAIANLMAKQKMAEYARTLKAQEQVAQILGATPQAPQGAPITADQAISAGGMPVGPTVQRAALIGQPSATPAQSTDEIKFGQYMKIADMYTALGDGEKAKRYVDMAYQIKPREEVTGQPFEMTDYATGKPVTLQQFKSGRLQTTEGFGPKRDMVLQTIGGRTVAVDRSKLSGGESFTHTLAPQVVGGAETGYYVVGGGGGGVSAAPAAGGQRTAATPSVGSTIMRPDYRPASAPAAGQVVPPVGVASGLTPLIAGTGPKPTEQYNKMALGVLNTSNAVNNFTSRLEGFGASDMFDPARRAELNSAHSNAMLQAKELYNLGVLTGGDEEILNKVLANPVDFKSSLTPISAIKKQADDLQTVIANANKNLSTVFKQPELTIPKPPEKPTAKPAALQEGATGVSKSGQPMIVRNGIWEYVK